MLALRASSKPQELENASFEPLRSPRGSKMLRENSLFELLRSARARNRSNRMLEEAVEAAVEDASKLFRSRWPRSGLAGSDFARSRSATDEGSIDR